MRIVALLKAIQTDFKAQFTGLKACELHGGRFDLAELKRIAGRAPAIYISVLGNPGLDDPGTGERDVTLTLAAFVVTTDRRGLPRFEAAIDLVERLLVHIPDNRWGCDGTFGAQQLGARNFYNGAIDKHGVALWGVIWKQSIRLGESVWAAKGFLPTEAYLGLGSHVGSGHEDDYCVLDGGET